MMSPTDPVKEEEKSEAEVEAELRLKKEEENLGKVIHTFYCSLIMQRSLWKMKNSAAS
jgi:hypothetical protein